MTREKISGIYCIENVENGMKYIGFARDIHDRWVSHKTSLKGGYHCNKYMQSTYNKYGESIFEYYIIQVLEDSEELLKNMEVYWISYYNSYILDGGGYNLTRGGDGTWGMKHTEETKNKLSEMNSGEKSFWFGRHHTEESKQKISESNMGRVSSEETIQKRKDSMPDMSGENNPMFGKEHSEETKKKISDKAMGRVFSDETLKKLSESHIGLEKTKETRQKLSDSNIGKKKGENTSSSHVGITYIKSSKKWSARINISGKRVFLGNFITEQEAIAAYDKKLNEIGGLHNDSIL
jgi:group I intron endonuclease